MKIGILQTAPNNCAALDQLARRYPGVEIVHYVDGCVWELYLAAGQRVTEKCAQIMAADFNKMLEAGCQRLGLLCNLIKPGVALAQTMVPQPIVVYDDVQARRAVAVTPPGGKIAVVAMKETPLEPSRQAVLAAARQAGKEVSVCKLCIEAAQHCLEETGRTDWADAYVERFLRKHAGEYHAFVIPQGPLTRLMPRLRDLPTPVFDSMEPFVEALALGEEE